MENKNYDLIIVGAGFAGSVVARIQAEKGKKILMIEKRNHIGGNAYDYLKDGILIHQYGPHIFHTNSKEVFDYLSRFTSWYKYEHRVLGHVANKLIPIPFNMKSIEECFDETKANKLKTILTNEYGEGKKVPILELLKNEDHDIKELSNFVFENIFKYYTMKQWGLEADEIDPAVTARVPINISYDDRYFNDEYQYMPTEGYTKIFKSMLEHENIDVILNEDAKKYLKLDFKNKSILFNNEIFNGQVIFTGQVDDLLDYKMGELPYRSVELELERKDGTFQVAATENYPSAKELVPYTRITEYKHFMLEENKELTYIHTEFPYAYNRNATKGNIPYYPIFTKENQEQYNKYVDELSIFTNLHLLGRLAEYKYYNMDAIVLKAIELANSL